MCRALKKHDEEAVFAGFLELKARNVGEYCGQNILSPTWFQSCL